jgi:2-oxoglutarate dehydrogenase E1 component
MYEIIKSHPSTRELYAQRLIRENLLSQQEDAEWVEHYRQALEQNQPLVSSLVSEPNKELFVDWSPYLNHRWDVAADTRVSLAELKALSERMGEVPSGFVVHRVVRKLLDDRLKMGAGAQEVNWGFAETMAYGSLLQEGFSVRLAGQDVGRGTFSHRHAVLHNQKEGDTWVPLESVTDERASFQIFDSLLSEEAVLAFEYGLTQRISYLGGAIW